MALQVKVKWGKEKYDVELDPSEPPEVFRAQLYASTNVEPDNQKLMFKGKTVQETWDGFKLKAGMSFLLMGSASEQQLVAPAGKVVFEEDLSEANQLKASTLPPGLPNLGNTCYLNSAMQCMRAVPDLQNELERFSKDTQVAAGSDTKKGLVFALKSTFAQMKAATNSDAIAAMMGMTVQMLRQVNPRFGEKNEQGHPSQQDAGEAWSELFRAMQECMPMLGSTDPAAPGKSVVDQLFSVKSTFTMTCAENPEEESTTVDESSLQLQCNITKDTGYMRKGLELFFEQSIEKRSPSLGRDALYQKKGAMSRIPAYLCVSFVRFFYKKKEQTECKIGKDVKFELELDLMLLCAPDLQKKLVPQRDAHEAYRNYEAEKEVDGNGAPGGQKGEEAEVEYLPHSFEDDAGSNNSGYYTLQAVLTHKGRASTSGHYISWVKQPDGVWLQFDDDNVKPVEEAEVMKLSGSGGADWHTAYILIYGPKRLRKIPDSGGAAPMETETAPAPAATEMETAE